MQKLGDYIREVDVRNKDLKVTNLLGVSINKSFIPSIANLIGADLSNYKIIERKHFVYVPVTSRNGEKLSIALLNDCENAIVSQAYTVFEIIDEEKLLPEYLMMWFKRPEFDRYARFHSNGSAREVFDWSEMCDVLLPIPSIEQQKEIVSEYETISKRIKLNEQIIKNLEATAQTLYHKMFVEGIDKENLPEGWRIGTLGEIAEIIMGQSPDGETYNLNGKGAIFYQGRADFGKRFPSVRVYTTSPTRFAKEGDILLSVRAPVGDINIALQDCCIGRGLASLRSKENCQSYLYYQLCNLSNVFNISDDEGTIFGSITKDDLHNIEVIIPLIKSMIDFENIASVVDKKIKSKDRENYYLTELQSLLLAKMGK